MSVVWELVRTHLYPDSTLGELHRGDIRVCWTLEDTYRGSNPGAKIHGQTAIPNGRYKLSVSRSPRFKREMVLLEEVPNFEGVRIHGGNTHRDTEGCPLVAYHRDIASRKIWGTAEEQVTGLVKADIEDFGEVWLDVRIDLIEQEIELGEVVV